MPPINAQPDGPLPINCPKCGAPAVLPHDTSLVTISCAYCDETFTIPQSVRDAQEKRLRGLRNTPANGVTVGALVFGLVIVGVLISAAVVYIGSRTIAVVIPRPLRDAPPKLAPPPSVLVPKASPEIAPPDGEARVKELMAKYASFGCTTVLLPATAVVGGRDIDAKFVANGRCVRLLAASGVGDRLELSMKTPKGNAVKTPTPAAELDFIHCAKQTGLHPATIRSSGEHPFTVASIECPRG